MGMCHLEKNGDKVKVFLIMLYIKGRIYSTLAETISLLAFRLIKTSSCAESAHFTASSIATSQKEQ